MPDTRPKARALGRRAGRALRGPDTLLAVGLALAAAALYAATSHADWVFDSLRYADYTQRDELSSLLLLLHALANLVPLAIHNSVAALGWDGGSLPVLEAVAVAGAAIAVAVVFATARTLSVSRPAAVVAAALLAVSLGAWRGAASAGVYGLTLLVLALAWLALVRYALAPSLRRAAVLGAAAGLAVATHLATITLVPLALALAALTGPGEGWRQRGRAAAAVAGGFVAVAVPLLILTAGLATEWSPDGIRAWFVGPHVPEADPSRTVGFGFGGLVTTVASELPPSGPGVLTDRAEGMALTATLAVLALGLGGAVAALRGPAAGRRAGAALVAGTALAVFAAGWYQAERPDYFALALVPLALLWALGIDGLAGALARGRSALVAAALFVVVVVPLAAWNLDGEVRQTLDRARQRAAAAETIAAAVPPGSRVVLSAQIAPRVAYDGASAATGWAALLEQVGEEGAPRPGLDSLLASEPGPVFVSSRAFELSPAQEQYLGAGEERLWARLRACCRPRAVGEFATDGGPETLYRVEPGRRG